MTVAKNPPAHVVGIHYYSDAYSRGIARALTLLQSSVSAASVGPGITRDRQTSDAYIAPLQNFRGLARAIARPSTANLPRTAHLPDTTSTADPVLLAMSAHQISGGI